MKNALILRLQYGTGWERAFEECPQCHCEVAGPLLWQKRKSERRIP